MTVDSKLRRHAMNKISRRTLRAAAIGLALFQTGTLWAAGTTGAQFLKIGVGARAMAMGGAYAAMFNDVHCLYWNPAGVARMKRPQLASSYNLMYQDTSQGFMGYAHPTRIGVFGGGLNYLQVADIEKRTGDSARPLSTFSAKDSALFFSYAIPNAWAGMSLGANIKLINLKLDDKSANAYSLDLGAQQKIKELPLVLGLSVLNLGSQVKLGTESDSLPLGIKAGATYSFMNNSLLLATGVDSWPQEKLTYAQFGVEWKPVPLLSLRTGPQVGGQRQDLGSLVGMSAGLGVQVRMLDVDYAYVPFGDLGDTHRLSLRVTF
jgi:hypothetical protein